MKHTDVVVGVDGSDSSQVAVRWAADAAHQRDCRLHVVAASEWPWPKVHFGGADDLERYAHRQFDRVVDLAVAKARFHHPDLEVIGSIVLGDPASVLVDTAHTATMVVVGNRGHGGFASLLLGSVSQKVATHSTAPVVVVRGFPRPDGPVVVGYDGSPAAEHALTEGFEEAARHRVPLTVVQTFAAPAGITTEHVATTASLETDLVPWRNKYPDVAVTPVAHAGTAAAVLTEMSYGARLVVVGHRGRGPVTGTVLGSVGLHLLHHALCPVMIVHTEGIPS